MILKISVLVAGLLQPLAAAYLSIGTFEESARALPVFIQPAGWAFSIWGLIYTLSIIYAVYQIIPKYDNPVLDSTRLPALIGFVGSIVWLYFAGMSSALVWLTVVILFVMAIAFTYVVRAKESQNIWENRLAKYILLPYAAWTGIACWVNIQALLVERALVTGDTINYFTNAVLFVGIATFTLYYFKKSRYNLWYGGVMIWASIAIVAANLEAGSLIFALLAGAFAVTALGFYLARGRASSL